VAGLFNWRRVQDCSVITGNGILTCIAAIARTTRATFSIHKTLDREISSLVVLAMTPSRELCGNQRFMVGKATTSQTMLRKPHIFMVVREMTVVEPFHLLHLGPPSALLTVVQLRLYLVRLPHLLLLLLLRLLL